MAILRGLDGQFYDVPDEHLSKYLIPPDKVKEKVQSGGPDYGPPDDPGPPPGHGSAPAIIVQIYGASAPPGSTAGAPAPGAGITAEVQPYTWWNTWRNTAGPGWHNAWHNRA